MRDVYEWCSVEVLPGWVSDQAWPPRFRLTVLDDYGTIELQGGVLYVGEGPGAPGPAFLLPEYARPGDDNPWLTMPWGTDLTRWLRVLATGECYLHMLPNGELPPLVTPAPDDARSWLRAYGPLEIRATHPYGFRPGEWATLVSSWDDSLKGRVCWLMRWPDLTSDYGVVGDTLAGWEYRRP